MIETGNAFEVDVLTWLLSASGWAGGNTSLRLFTNDVDAGLTLAQKKALTNASFTEATFAGYAAKTLTAASWTITGGLPTAAVYATQTWQRSSTGAAQTVYGYWIRRVSDSRLLHYEKFVGPLTFQFLGDQYGFAPRIPCKDGNDA